MDEQQPETKQAIIQRNQAAATRMNATLSRLTDEQLLAPDALGEWSLRDVLSHLGNQWLAEQIESHLEGREPDALAAWGTTEPPGPEFDMTTNDGRNAWQQQVRQQESVGEVRDRYHRFLERMDRAIERFPDEEFARPYALRYPDFVGRVRPAADGEAGFPLWQWIRGDYWHHLEDHLPSFEAAAEASKPA